MNDPGISSVHALPDGEAELHVVLRLQWDDVATLGRDAGRLAARLQRPVTLDEAVSHRLRATGFGVPAVTDGSPRTTPLTQSAAFGSLLSAGDANQNAAPGASADTAARTEAVGRTPAPHTLSAPDRARHASA
ncbi:hypothetical protein ABZ702_22140 [Streptomyces cyaneofuscatus]|uniref:hypothetical protein n=1 Tax=Streptomyces cyaneofuscatus TaxID=66883 RepID=UPI0033E46D90